MMRGLEFREDCSRMSDKTHARQIIDSEKAGTQLRVIFSE